MTSRERVLCALRHKEGDRVPTGENQVDGKLAEAILGRPTLATSGWKELNALWDGKRDEIVQDYGATIVALAEALDWDYVRVPAVYPRADHHRPAMTGPSSWIGENGIEMTFNPDHGSIILPARYPEMATGDLPDPDERFVVNESQLEAVRYVVQQLGQTHFVVGRLPLDGTFPWEETVGLEEFLTRMITEPAFVERAVDAYVGRSLAWIDAMFDAGVHAVMSTDDYCDNRGPVMGRDLFLRFVLPGIRRQVEATHARGGVFVKHTDGNTWNILRDLIEAGVDAWHGIQPAIGMDLGALKQRFGRSLCFFGGVDCDTLVRADTEAARQEARQAIRGAAPGGGLVVTCSNVLQPGVKLENYMAVRDEIRLHGTYPIGGA
jgi:uroporphyrinogen decarboxylase